VSERGDRLRDAQQRRVELRQSAVSLGFASVLRAGKHQIQVQTLRGRLWVPVEALHPSTGVRGLGDSGTLVVRLWWARAKRLEARS